MTNAEKVNKLNMDGVNLLVSILVCYPEIGTLSFEPSDESLKMTFALGKATDNEGLQKFKNFVERSVQTYYVLERIKKASIDIRMTKHEDIVFLNIIRDIKTLSKGEIALITTLVREEFGSNLVADINPMASDEECIVQDDFIDNMIGNLIVNHNVEKLIGIREEGRVMVFNK